MSQDCNCQKPKDEAFKFSFWISQFFILAATVLGVYLASTQGFKQAIAYGEIQADKNNYYLRKSLCAELSDNITRVREYMGKLETGSIAARKEPFALDTFIWENMRYSTATLETPSELLRESRLFYRGIADIQEKIANNAYSAKTGVQKLQELVDNMDNKVLKDFEQNIADLKESLKNRGIDV